MTDRKFAFLFNTTTDDTPQTLTSMEHAVDLAEAGYEVRIYFDGAATAWPGHLADNPGNPVTEYYRTAKEQGLIAGACGLCALNFGARSQLEAEDIEMLGSVETHGVDVSSLVDDGFEFTVVS
jgi:hypothetical protein